MDKFEKKMKDAGLTEAAIAAFRMNYDQLAGGATGLVSLAFKFRWLAAKCLRSARLMTC